MMNTRCSICGRVLPVVPYQMRDGIITDYYPIETGWIHKIDKTDDKNWKTVVYCPQCIAEKGTK